jgi:hypothetical protein
MLKEKQKGLSNWLKKRLQQKRLLTENSKNRNSKISNTTRQSLKK